MKDTNTITHPKYPEQISLINIAKAYNQKSGEVAEEVTRPCRITKTQFVVLWSLDEAGEKPKLIRRFNRRNGREMGSDVISWGWRVSKESLEKYPVEVPEEDIVTVYHGRLVTYAEPSIAITKGKALKTPKQYRAIPPSKSLPGTYSSYVLKNDPYMKESLEELLETMTALMDRKVASARAELKRAEKEYALAMEEMEQYRKGELKPQEK